MNAQNGLSTNALAKKCKISSASIFKVINGKMSITIPMAMAICNGLGVPLDDLLAGLTDQQIEAGKSHKVESQKSDHLSIGILSINNKRITCIKDHTGKVIGRSELNGGLDLTETTGALINLIQAAISEALPKTKSIESKLRFSKLNLVTQSYEFEDTRTKFALFAKKYFKEVILLPDWQITYLTDFKKNDGVSLVVDKGVSLSYMHNEQLKKLGGWKFPVYDIGGENWLGVETIRHTIEAVEGFTPMTELAQNVLSKFNGKIEKITETCFKGEKNTAIYSLFAEPLLRAYFTGDKTAKNIVTSGFQAIHRLVNKADEILGEHFRITLNGSLSDVYRPFFENNRLISPSSNTEKAELLADITNDFLKFHGINS